MDEWLHKAASTGEIMVALVSNATATSVSTKGIGHDATVDH